MKCNKNQMFAKRCEKAPESMIEKTAQNTTKTRKTVNELNKPKIKNSKSAPNPVQSERFTKICPNECKINQFEKSLK